MAVAQVRVIYETGTCRRGYCSGSPITEEGFCSTHQAEQNLLRTRLGVTTGRCGSEAGYVAHLRAKASPCNICRAAHAAYRAAQRAMTS